MIVRCLAHQTSPSYTKIRPPPLLHLSLRRRGALPSSAKETPRGGLDVKGWTPTRWDYSGVRLLEIPLGRHHGAN
ncbi:hypothetical protein N7495_008915 [Penicillium taxi]|uniref:uncharacterized protein n=1 Tax=Penicillium taxi TaxID=168475 RepID=UPI00254582FC|nr:uncharacterized protein N7495_008915 [Penicillium taxi]KAJ5888874.1 hypothetical protein N7495_008915 [Penicillium taxi]